MIAQAVAAPRSSASMAAIVMLLGLALIYWSLTGLGALVPDTSKTTTP